MSFYAFLYFYLFVDEEGWERFGGEFVFLAKLKKELEKGEKDEGMIREDCHCPKEELVKNFEEKKLK